MYRIIFIILNLFGFGVLAFAQSRPNIILIVADDLGYGDIGVNGQQKIRTPSIDALARSGIRFTQFYSGATVCAPSRESMLTGRTAANCYIRGNFLTDQKEDPPLPQSRLTIAEYLQNFGYSTALIGKWGLGGEKDGPGKQGFTYSFGYLDQIHAHDYYTDYLYENGRKTQIAGNARGKKTEYSADMMLDKAFEYLDTVSRKNPFFLYLPITLPHGKYDLADEGEYAAEKWEAPFRKYAAMIGKLDKGIGEIMAMIKKKGIAENTIVIFTSDNGANPQFAKFFSSNGIFRGAKRDPYDGGIHVPLIISWTGKIKPGMTSDFVCAAWDLFPTISEWLGRKPAEGMDGISLVPVLTGKTIPVTRPPLYWEYYEYNYNWDKPGSTLPRNWLDNRAIRDGKWKAVISKIRQNRGQNIELYDLSDDASESKDVAGKYPAVTANMKKLFEARFNQDSEFFPYKK